MLKHIKMHFKTDQNDRLILILFCISLQILILIRIKFPILRGLNDTFIENILTSSITIEITNDLSVGFISACIFYFLVTIIPKVRLITESTYTLNSLLASLLDSYNRTRVFGHETPITHVDRSTLSIEWLDKTVEKLKKHDTQFLSLKFALATAHTRYDDFKNTLQLANTLGAKPTLKWIVIVDKVRLIAENYDKQPFVNNERIRSIDDPNIDDDIGLFKKTLEFRFQEFCEEVRDWIIIYDSYEVK
ncbi:hypothetical protein LEP1GSC195_1478 [Leptospira wolbachii serovar Codice str. CDC]|uniref:Uncharacterized protein n=2 Tax=Leptospira TaxID=171 RepID=R9A7W8_9LEPT|nr:hypothetical protein LEP1GSC195_1478 [Leptospira wolbachii serovar Codice str. CDC]